MGLENGFISKDPNFILAAGEASPIPQVTLVFDGRSQPQLVSAMSKLILAGVDPQKFFKERDIQKLEQNMSAPPERAAAFAEYKKVLLEESRRQIAAQNPHANGKISDRDLLIYAHHALVIGGFSVTVNPGMDNEGNSDGSGLCVTAPYQEANFLTAGPLAFRPLPGTQAMWQIFIGAHEGAHCTNTPYATPLQKLKEETKADSVGIAALLKRGQHEMVQAVIDVRIIRAVLGDKEHASGFFISANGAVSNISERHVQIIDGLNSQIMGAVARLGNMKPEEAQQLMLNEPQKFIDLVKQCQQRGDFKAGGAENERFVAMFVGAFERRADLTVSMGKDLTFSDSVDFNSTVSISDYIALNKPEIMGASSITVKSNWAFDIKGQSFPEFFNAKSAGHQPVASLELQLASLDAQGQSIKIRPS